MELLLDQSLAMFREIGSQQGAPEVLETMAGVAAARADPARAGELVKQADAIRTAIGAPRPVAWQKQLERWRLDLSAETS